MIMKKINKIKNIIIFFILILTTGISSAQISALPSQQMEDEQQQQQKTQNIFVGVMVASAAVSAIIIGVIYSKAHMRAKIEEAKFQSSVGKTKSEIYTLFGPPNSIVDDGQGQGQGGTILEYQTITTSGGDGTNVITTTFRRMFYLNSDNIVTSVKEDNK